MRVGLVADRLLCPNDMHQFVGRSLDRLWLADEFLIGKQMIYNGLVRLRHKIIFSSRVNAARSVQYHIKVYNGLTERHRAITHLAQLCMPRRRYQPNSDIIIVVWSISATIESTDFMHSYFPALRQRVQAYVRRDLSPDMLAGLTGATAGAPQAMAFAILAGINPVYGLYTAIVSTIVAAFLGSATFMTTGPTNAIAVVVGSSLTPFTAGDDPLTRLVTLTFLVGVGQAGVGLLRLGELTRYVSGAVMTGFITGAALLVILGQFSHLTGIHTEAYSRVMWRVGDALTHLDKLHLPTLLAGLTTIALIVALHRTRLTYFATLIAICLVSLGVALLSWEVELVRDIGLIPSSLPALIWPEPDMMPDLAIAAPAIAVLSLVQTAALAQSITDTEPDEASFDTSREFVAQGVANLAGSLFQGMPAGGSLSRTAVNIKAGARTRLANAWSGIFVALIMLAFGGLAERIALTALAGHLVVAAASLISPERIMFTWRASWTGRGAMVATFVSTLVLPLQYSVYVGVVLSLVLYIAQSSHIHLTQLVPAGENLFREVSLPDSLPDDQPVIVSVNGHLFFAAMRELQERLPDPHHSEHPVVILRLRGDSLLAGTGAATLITYARRLRDLGGMLILCGVEPPVLETLARTGALEEIGEENVFPAHDILFTSLQDALAHAQRWLAEQRGAKTG